MGDEDCLTVGEWKRLCELKHKEIEGLEKWIAKIDNRLWTVGIGLVFNLIGVIAILVKGAK